MDTKTYGGHTVAALRDFIAHSQENGESIDDITGDCASSAEIIRDLLAALPSDAARAPIIAWATDDDRVITDRQKQLAIAAGGASASSVKPFSVPLYAAPVAPAAPQGWKLVPVTASDEMLIALLSGGEADALAGCKDGYIASRLLQASGVAERYSAMLSAAPTPTVAADAAAPKIVAHPGERVSMTYEQYVALRDGSAAKPDERASAPQAALTDERELLAKFLDFADSDYVPNVLFDRARALLATAPTERMSDASRDGEGHE